MMRLSLFLMLCAPVLVSAQESSGAEAPITTTGSEGADALDDGAETGVQAPAGPQEQRAPVVDPSSQGGFAFTGALGLAYRRVHRIDIVAGLLSLALGGTIPVATDMGVTIGGGIHGHLGRTAGKLTTYLFGIHAVIDLVMGALRVGLQPRTSIAVFNRQSKPGTITTSGFGLGLTGSYDVWANDNGHAVCVILRGAAESFPAGGKTAWMYGSTLGAAFRM